MAPAGAVRHVCDSIAAGISTHRPLTVDREHGMQHIKAVLDQLGRLVQRDSREPWSYFGSFGDDFFSEDDDEWTDG
jgi:hypothetical protein